MPSCLMIPKPALGSTASPRNPELLQSCFNSGVPGELKPRRLILPVMRFRSVSEEAAAKRFRNFRIFSLRARRRRISGRRLGADISMTPDLKLKVAGNSICWGEIPEIFVARM